MLNMNDSRELKICAPENFLVGVSKKSQQLRFLMNSGKVDGSVVRDVWMIVLEAISSHCGIGM